MTADYTDFAKLFKEGREVDAMIHQGWTIIEIDLGSQLRRNQANRWLRENTLRGQCKISYRGAAFEYAEDASFFAIKWSSYIEPLIS